MAKLVGIEKCSFCPEMESRGLVSQIIGPLKHQKGRSNPVQVCWQRSYARVSVFIENSVQLRSPFQEPGIAGKTYFEAQITSIVVQLNPICNQGRPPGPIQGGQNTTTSNKKQIKGLNCHRLFQPLLGVCWFIKCFSIQPVDRSALMGPGNNQW